MAEETEEETEEETKEEKQEERERQEETEVVWVGGESILRDEGLSQQKSAGKGVRWDATYVAPGF
jgi:hypothetical protein